MTRSAKSDPSKSVGAIVVLMIFVAFDVAEPPPSATPTAPAAASPQPGILISAANSSTYARLLPPGADLAIKYGLTMRVVPARRLDWSAGFTSETEQYSRQVRLDKDDYITNYIAGMVFPTASTNDPKAAIKVAYNCHMVMRRFVAGTLG